MQSVKTAQGSGEALRRLPGHARHQGCPSEQQVLEVGAQQALREQSVYIWTVQGICGSSLDMPYIGAAHLSS